LFLMLYAVRLHATGGRTRVTGVNGRHGRNSASTPRDQMRP